MTLRVKERLFMVIASVLFFNVPALALTFIALRSTHSAYRDRALTLVSHCYLAGAIVLILIGASMTSNDKPPASFQFSDGSSVDSSYLWLCGVLIVTQTTAAYLATALVLNGNRRPWTSSAVWPAPGFEAPSTPAAAGAREELSRKQHESGATVVVILPCAKFAVGYLESGETAKRQMGGRSGVISNVDVVDDLAVPSSTPRQ
jgi:hypothetical protein